MEMMKNNNNFKNKNNKNKQKNWSNNKVYNPNSDLKRQHDGDDEPNFNLISEIDEYGIHKSRPKSYIEKEHKKYGYSVNTLTGQPVTSGTSAATNSKKQGVSISKVWRPDGEKWQGPNTQQGKNNTSAPAKKNKPTNGKNNPHKKNENPKFKTGQKPNKPFKPGFKGKNKPNNGGERKANEPAGDALRLNKFLSQQGIASRRKADELIENGQVKINGKKITDLGTKINPSHDRVVVSGEPIANYAEQHIYFLLNKPKDTITTMADEKDRRIVMDLIDEDYRTKVVPVGRLDRDTTGVLLLCNDGELIHRLTHPSYEIPRTYHVVLNDAITKVKMNRIQSGVELEDGIAKISSIEYYNGLKNEVVLTLSEGKNREIRRLFESLGYEVQKLDRMNYAGITTEGLKRGESRQLNKKEISYLKSLVNL